jgi:hypothetical protein
MKLRVTLIGGENRFSKRPRRTKFCRNISNAPCQRHSRALLKTFQRQDNHLVNVRIGGNCAAILFVEVTLAICEFKTLRQSRSRQALHENASHGSAIGEHGTFLATRFCLGFTSLTIPEKIKLLNQKEFKQYFLR